MSLLGDVRALLDPLVAGRAYPDVPPDTQEYPLITYQQVGGQAFWHLEKTMPGYRHARIQVNVWSQRRLEADEIGRAVERAFCAAPFPTEPFGALVSLYEAAMKLYGTRQDFGIWVPEP